MTFDTAGRSGQQAKTVTVTTNDPNNTNVRLRVSADIEVVFGFEPQRVNLGRQRYTDIKSVTLESTGTKLADVRILSATVDNPEHAQYYTINIEDTGSGESRQLRLTVEPTEHLPIGRISDKLDIKTNLPELGSIDVFITGEILGPIDIIPRSLVLRSDSDDTPFTGSITLTPGDDVRFNVISAECRDSTAEVTVLKPDPDGKVVIEMTYPNDGQTTRFRSEIIIQTDLPAQPQLNVPVFVQQTRRGPDRTRR